MSNKTTENFTKLVNWFLKNGDRVIVALSGGVDSAVVALAAKRHSAIMLYVLLLIIKHFPMRNCPRPRR